MKRLTVGLIKRRHKKQPSGLVKKIEKTEVDRGVFGRIVQAATKMKPFDKKR